MVAYKQIGYSQKHGPYQYRNPTILVIEWQKSFQTLQNLDALFAALKCW